MIVLKYVKKNVLISASVKFKTFNSVANKLKDISQSAKENICFVHLFRN